MKEAYPEPEQGAVRPLGAQIMPVEQLGTIKTFDGDFTMNDEKLKRPMIKKRIRDVESISIDEWSAKYPYYYQWLLDNGFRYRECYDKNRIKKLKSLSTFQKEKQHNS